MNQLLHKIFINKKIKKNDLLFFIFLTFFIILLIFIKVDSVGLLSLISVALLTFYISSHYKYLATILYVALGLRLITIFLGIDLITLPDSIGDSSHFEMRAWKISQEGFFGVFSNFPQDSSSHHISWILAFFYSLTDRSPIMGQSINLMFGMGSVLLGSRLAHKIWDKQISQKVGWILALYPTLILYSCLILRESFVWFFLLLALYGITCWVKDKSFKSFIFILIGFSVATFFHGGMFVGGLIFLIIFSFIYFVKIIKDLKYLKISTSSLIILIILITIAWYITTNISYIPKFHNIVDNLSFEYLLKQISNRNFTRVGPVGAAYPEWTVPKNSLELIFKFPIRLIYFLLSPFPWDIKKTVHLFGLFDGLFHLMLLILFIKNFKSIWSNRTLKIISIILISYFILYTFAGGNFGTGLRHRTKFIIVLIVLVAPWIPKIIFNKK
jgi:4-amino-4-deoxy-L-arabinose transferase-like glycosyltransferase